MIAIDVKEYPAGLMMIASALSRPEFDDRAFKVRLMERQTDPHRVRELATLGFNRLQCRVSINVRLANSQEIEIRSIYDRQSRCHRYLRCPEAVA